MGEKLCPVDKKACILNRCMIFDEEQEKCSWANTGSGSNQSAGAKKPPENKKPKKKAASGPSSGYRVHLFD